MPAYLLQAIPDQRQHPAWKVSSHNFECISVAPDEPTARRNADQRFRCLDAPLAAGSPWDDPALVQVKRVIGEGHAALLPNGAVLPVMDWVVR